MLCAAPLRSSDGDGLVASRGSHHISWRGQHDITVLFYNLEHSKGRTCSYQQSPTLHIDQQCEGTPGFLFLGPANYCRRRNLLIVRGNGHSIGPYISALEQQRCCSTASKRWWYFDFTFYWSFFRFLSTSFDYWSQKHWNSNFKLTT